MSHACLDLRAELAQECAKLVAWFDAVEKGIEESVDVACDRFDTELHSARDLHRETIDELEDSATEYFEERCNAATSVRVGAIDSAEEVARRALDDARAAHAAACRALASRATSPAEIQRILDAHTEARQAAEAAFDASMTGGRENLKEAFAIGLGQRESETHTRKLRAVAEERDRLLSAVEHASDVVDAALRDSQYQLQLRLASVACTSAIARAEARAESDKAIREEWAFNEWRLAGGQFEGVWHVPMEDE